MCRKVISRHSEIGYKTALRNDNELKPTDSHFAR